MIKDFGTYVNEGLLDRNASDFVIAKDKNGNVSQVTEVRGEKQLLKLLSERLGKSSDLDLSDVIVCDIENHRQEYVLKEVYSMENYQKPTSIVFPKFENCDTRFMTALSSSNTRLERIVLNPTVYVVDEMFRWDKSLKEIVFAEGDYDFLTIGYSAFQGCTALENVELPEGVTVIRGNAFYGCPNLKHAKIPDSINIVGDAAFGHCDKNLEFDISNEALLKIFKTHVIDFE
jgi:hypothetical protein